MTKRFVYNRPTAPASGEPVVLTSTDWTYAILFVVMMALCGIGISIAGLAVWELYEVFEPVTTNPPNLIP